MAKVSFKMYSTPEETLRVLIRDLNFALNNLNNINVTVATSDVVTANSIKDTMINWGAGLGQVSAEDVPVVDAGPYFIGTNLESVTQEIGSTLLNLASSRVHITNTGGYYASSNVEDALNQIGSTLLNIPAENVKINDTGGYFNSTSVENALAEMYSTFSTHRDDSTIHFKTSEIGITSTQVSVDDTGGYYSGGNVESVLQEIGSHIRYFTDTVLFNSTGYYKFDINSSNAFLLSSTGATLTGDLGVTMRFGCNGQSPQSAYTIENELSTSITGSTDFTNPKADSSDLNLTNSLINQIRSALIANGILTS